MSNVPLERKLATTIKRRGDWTAIKFHDTEIVRFNEEVIKLDSGGWQTVTTKRRMNQASSRFLLSFGVYQTRGDWFISFMDADYNHGDPIPFYDGITLSRDRTAPRPSETQIPGERDCNGWPNRATWNCFLWLNNRECDYRRYVEQARREPFTMMSAKRFVLHLWNMRNIFEARTPDGEPLTRVHWDRIADAMNEGAKP